MLAAESESSFDPAWWELLSPTQRSVARELAAGLSNKEIAAKLSISPATVKTHVGAILERLHQPTRCRVIALWIKSPPAWTDLFAG